MGPSGFKQAGLGQLDNNPYGPSMVPQPSPFDRTPSRITPFNPDAFPSRDTLARAGTESDKIDIGEPSRGSTPDPVHRKNQSLPVTNDSSSEVIIVVIYYKCRKNTDWLSGCLVE